MKMITLDVIKKNRVYFKCKNERGYEVKLKVTTKSENISLGKNNLLVKDVSVRTKYGTDIIYDMEEKIESDKIITLKSKFNRELVKCCKNLGGKWDKDSQAWIFSSSVEDKVEELDELYNSRQITIEITAKQNVYGSQEAVYFCGYGLAYATSRDSGAKLFDDVALINGECTSGGSSKNWLTMILENSKLRLKIAEKVLAAFSFEEDWEAKIINS